ncbi:MAG TPA: YcaO-related McrA-glycine thioamidation protein [Methanomicrobia archaeon]|nr:YcaO-related McrA-glycine thioamidation protein [Methanomicrobia archaeon]
MELKSCIKRYKRGTHRAVPPAETLSRVESKLPAAGVTEVTDITGLDRIGIPVFICRRPSAASGTVTVHNGKGTTPEEAQVSAIMEAVERCSAEVGDRELVMESYARLEKREHVLNPSNLILPGYVRDVEHIRIPWVEGYDLLQDESIYVPANAVFHPLSPPYDRNRLFRTNTNGLAGGNELEEAIFHGLAEVIERDAWSLVEATRDTGPLVRVPDGEIRALVDKFLNVSVSVLIREITSDVGVPTFAAVSDDEHLQDPTLLTIGMGTHTNASVALKRAITEVAQSRLTQIHGARSGSPATAMNRLMGYEWMRKQNQHWFEMVRHEDFAAAATRSLDTNDFREDIKHVLTRLNERGFERVIVVNVTREAIGVPVVRVIVPGLEQYGVDGDRIGERCAAARRARSSVTASS